MITLGSLKRLSIAMKRVYNEVGEKAFYQMITDGMQNVFKYRTNDLRFLFVEVTNRCNMPVRCEGCLQGDDNSRQEKNPLLADDAFFKIVNKVDTVILTGGEPLMPDAKWFVEKLANEHSGTVVVLTNGLALDEKIAHLFSKSSRRMIGVSIDGTELFHNQRRGEGSYESVAKNTALLKNNFWFVMTTITAKNINNVMSEEFVNEMAKLGAYAILYLPYMPTDCLANNELVLTNEHLAFYKQRISVLKKLNNGCIPFDVFDAELKGMRGCGAGSKVGYIKHNGYYIPCPFNGLSPFKITDRYESEDLSHPFLKDLSKIAHKCNYQCILRTQAHEVEKCKQKYGDEIVDTSLRTQKILSLFDK